MSKIMSTIMSKQSKLSKQAGLTLIELSIAIVVAGLLITGALMMFSSTSKAQKSLQMSQDIMAIKVGMKSVFGGQGSYLTATNHNGLLINAGKVPSTLRVTGSAIATADGNEITVTGTATTFTITITAVEKAICIALLPSLVDYTSVTAGATTAITALPITPMVADTSCAAATQSIVLVSN